MSRTAARARRSPTTRRPRSRRAAPTPKPGASFIAGCPEFRNRQENKLTLGLQPVPLPLPGANGHLLGGFDGQFIGQITANGLASVTSHVEGCDIGTDPPSRCTGDGADSRAEGRGLRHHAAEGGAAQLRWRFDDKPSAGPGGSEHPFPPCWAAPIGGDTDGDFSAGERTVPRAVFEASTPQTLAVAIDVVLPAPDLAAPGQIHAVESYTIRVQRVRGDGTPL